MATYLMVKHSNTTHSIKAKDEEPNKPYIKIKNGYFPLTTETANATGVFVKNGSQVYKIAQTYTTTIQSSSTYRSDYQTTRSSQYTQSNSSSGNVGKLDYYRYTYRYSNNNQKYSMSYTFTRENISFPLLYLGEISSNVEEELTATIYSSMSSITSISISNTKSLLDLAIVTHNPAGGGNFVTMALLYRYLQYTTLTKNTSYTFSTRNYTTSIASLRTINSTYSFLLTCTSFYYSTQKDANSYRRRQTVQSATIYYNVSFKDTLTRESQYNTSSEATSYYTVETTSE